ncbi:MAG: hypothetical protein LBG62_03735 [Candidatus Methanoplasma sp.]|jgi:tRNA threonylcarbamoyladenosine modification (KEOPS) complex  Pcc1 subunit|nr:hypothetical protein [Candidatus Methanoplasma sp.]
MLRLDVRLEYDRRRAAESVFEAVCPDNEGYVESELDGKAIAFRLEAESAGALKNTADDLLACVRAAEEACGLARSGPEGEE